MAFGNSCPNVMLRAETIDHRKEVLLCRYEDELVYNYGKVNAYPDVTFKTSIEKVKYCYDLFNHYGRVVISVPDEKTGKLYKIAYGGDVEQKRSTLMVLNSQGRPIRYQNIDPESIRGKIESGLAQTGLQEHKVE